MDDLVFIISSLSNVILPIALVLLGYFTGRYLERRHFKSIRMREEALRDLLVVQSKHPPQGYIYADQPLACGSVVISSDYFKSFIATLRMLIGGRVRSFESLLERARREAVLRMKEQAQASNGDMVINVRLDTARVFGDYRRQMRSVEAVAYGTVLVRDPQQTE